jgi:hypothetical protein
MGDLDEFYHGYSRMGTEKYQLSISKSNPDKLEPNSWNKGVSRKARKGNLKS